MMRRKIAWLLVLAALAVFAAQCGGGETRQASRTVYVTRTGAKYHRAGCASLSRSKIAMSLQEAERKGYGPCARCNP